MLRDRLRRGRWAAVVAVFLLGGCAGGRAHHAAAATKPPKDVVVTSNMNTSLPPGSTPETVLAGLLQPQNHVMGFVMGTVTGAGVGIEVPMGPTVAGYTAYPLLVTGYAGAGSPPYAKGATIQLRLPGGSVNGKTYLAEDSQFQPLRQGEDVFVLYRDQGDQGGGNAADRMVATIPGQDLFYVVGGTVSGDGIFASFKDDPAHFASRFSSR